MVTRLGKITRFGKTRIRVPWRDDKIDGRSPQHPCAGIAGWGIEPPSRENPIAPTLMASAIVVEVYFFGARTNLSSKHPRSGAEGVAPTIDITASRLGQP
jgi:hypothetical protein